MKKDFIPDGDAEMDSWEENLSTQIPLVAAALGIPAADVADIQSKITAARQKYADGQTAKALAKSALNAARTARKAFEKEIRADAKKLKTMGGYTEAIGLQLKMVGSEHTVDWPNAKPTISAVKDGDKIKLDWSKGDADGVAFFSQRGAETQFTLLGTDMEPPFFDTRPNLVANQPELREYYAVYLVKDEQRGKPSDTVSIKE